MAAVAGCQSGDSSDVLNVGGTGQGQTVPEGKVLQSELRAYCPKVALREGYAFLSSYEKKAEEDPTKLIYQASLATVTRKCTYAPGVINLEVAAAGRVVPGPLATDGTVKMPIRVEARLGDEVVYSNVADFEVAVSKTSGATQFIFNNANVSVPADGGTVQVLVGYDLPEKAKKAEDEL